MFFQFKRLEKEALWIGSVAWRVQSNEDVFTALVEFIQICYIQKIKFMSYLKLTQMKGIKYFPI